MWSFIQRSVGWLLILILWLQPAVLYAQSITVAGPDTGPRPRVDAAQNGTTVLNISTPNGSGVSHDLYTEFVADDLILNNSATNVNTQLAGWIEGNPNLTPGVAANLWIGEIVGGSQAQLNGILEVGGPAMDIILANEFGITCNGCGFINTSRATLTTGKPLFNTAGGFERFDVKQGKVTIGAGGLNPEARLALADTSQVNVIARAAAIYGQMRAQEINVITGANLVDYNWSYDPDTGTITGVTEQAGTGPAPALAVDVAALGGMYANAIQMVATENGVGARIDNDLVSSTNISLRADGQLQLGNNGAGLKARKKVTIRNQAPLLLEGSIRSEDNDLIDIRTSSGSLTFSGEAQGGGITLESAGMAHISAAIAAQGALKVTSLTDSVTLEAGSELSAASIDVDAAKAVALNGVISTSGAFDAEATTTLSSGANAELLGQTVTLSGANINTNGTITSNTTLNLQAPGAITNAAALNGQTIAITAGTDFTNTGIVAANALLTIDADATVTNAATLISGDDLNIYADQILNAGGVIWANDTVRLAKNAALDNATLVQNTNGRVEAFQGDLIVRADTVFNLGTAPTITSQIIKNLEKGSVGATDPSQRILQFVDPAFLDASGNIKPEHAAAFTALWSDLVLGGGTLSSEARSILKPTVVSPSGTAISSDLIGYWTQAFSRSNIAGIPNLGTHVADMVDPAIFDGSGDIRPEYAATYAALWQTLASGATTVDPAVKLILKNDVLVIESQTTDPDTGDVTTVYSDTLKPAYTNVWASIAAGSGAFYDIIKILYQDRFNDDGTLAELVAGRDVDIEADRVDNIFGNISAGRNVEITANTVENQGLGATQLLVEVHKRPDCFTCHEGLVSYYDTFGGRVEAVGNVTITGTLNNTTTTTSTLSGQDVLDELNAFINQQRAAGDSDFNGVPNASHRNLAVGDTRSNNFTAPVDGNGSDIREVIPVDTGNQTPVDVAPPVTPTLTPQAPVDALLVAGLTTIAETDPQFTEFSNFITSNYMMDVDRLEYRDDLINNTNETILAALERAGEAVIDADDLRALDGPVLVPNPDGSGLHMVYPHDTPFALNPDGALISGANIQINGPAVNNDGAILATNTATITATNITGSTGRFGAEDGTLALTALGRIDLSNTKLEAHQIDLIAGQDVTGRGIHINSATDTTIFGAAGVNLTSLEKEYTLALKKTVPSLLGGLGRGRDGTPQIGTRTITTLTQKTVDQHTSSLTVGGDLSIISSADLVLAGVAGDIDGDIDLSAGGNLLLTEVQSSTDVNAGKLRVSRVESHTTNLNAGGDFTAAAGGQAVLVGTGIDAGGEAQLAAAEGVVLAAAQDIFDYYKQTTKKGFLKKKTTTVTKTYVTNKGVRIAAAGDVDVIAEGGDLTTAGATFASATGDINLSAVEGNIYAGTYTDVFREHVSKSKSFLGGLISSSSSRTTTNHIATGTDALAALDLSLVSGNDTTLVGANLSAGGTLNINTGGDFSVEAAISSHREEFFESKMGWVTATTVTENSYDETAALTQLVAAAYNFDIGGATNITVYRDAPVNGSLDPASQAELRALIEGLYPTELLEQDGLTLLDHQLVHEYFYEKTTALSPAFKALVSIAVSAVAAPAILGAVAPGIAAAGGWVAASAKAFISTSIMAGLDAAVSGEFDLGDFLKDAAFSTVTAGLTAGINLNAAAGTQEALDAGKEVASTFNILGGEWSSTLSQSLFGNGNLSIANVLEGALDGVITSGLSSAVYDTDFTDSLSSSLINTVVNLTLADAQFEIGELGKGIDNWEGSPGHAILHGLAGCAAAAVQGADCAAGAAGGVAQSLYAGVVDGSTLSQDQQTQIAKVIGGIAGYAFSGGEANNVSTAAAIAQSGFKNNYLTHERRKEYEKLLKAWEEFKRIKWDNCILSKGPCSLPESVMAALVGFELHRTPDSPAWADLDNIERYLKASLEEAWEVLKEESYNNTRAMLSDCAGGVTNQACQNHLKEAEEFLEWEHRSTFKVGSASLSPGQLEWSTDLDKLIVEELRDVQNRKQTLEQAQVEIITRASRHDGGMNLLFGGLTAAGIGVGCYFTAGTLCYVAIGAGVVGQGDELADGAITYVRGQPTKNPYQAALIAAGASPEQAAKIEGWAEAGATIVEIGAGLVIAVNGGRLVGKTTLNGTLANADDIITIPSSAHLGDNLIDGAAARGSINTVHGRIVGIGDDISDLGTFKQRFASRYSSQAEADAAWRVYQQSSRSTEELVIGRLDDTAAGAELGMRRLNDPDWTINVNDAWIQGGIDARKPFYLGSNPNISNYRSKGVFDGNGNFLGRGDFPETIFFREMRQLRDAGYHLQGNYMIPPN